MLISLSADTVWIAVCYQHFVFLFQICNFFKYLFHNLETHVQMPPSQQWNWYWYLVNYFEIEKKQHQLVWEMRTKNNNIRSWIKGIICYAHLVWPVFESKPTPCGWLLKHSKQSSWYNHLLKRVIKHGQ